MNDFDWSKLAVETVYLPGTWPELEDLKKTLQKSAGYHARAALADYIRSDERYVDAAFHCGTAVEHLAKAYLASLHPALIAEKGDFDSLLVLTGHAQHAKGGRGSDIKTVGLEESCRRVKQLLPTFKPDPGVSTLSNVRNAAAHLSVTSRDDIRRAVRFMVQILVPLLNALDISPDDFWHEFGDVASTLRDESLAEVDRIVASKVESARQSLARRIEGLDRKTQKAVLRAISGKPNWTQDYEHPYPCPVCKQGALLICQFWQDEEDGQPDPGDGYLMPHVYALTDGFYCSACELELEDTETQALGMPEEIDLGYLPLDEYGRPMVSSGAGMP